MSRLFDDPPLLKYFECDVGSSDFALRKRSNILPLIISIYIENKPIRYVTSRCVISYDYIPYEQ